MSDSDHKIPDRAPMGRQAPAEAEVEAVFLAKVRALRAIRAGHPVAKPRPHPPSPA